MKWKVISPCRMLTSIRNVASPGRCLLLLGSIAAPVARSPGSGASHSPPSLQRLSLPSPAGGRRDAVWGYALPSVLPTLFSALNVRADEAASAAAETNAVSLPRRPPQFQRRAASLIFCPRLIALLLLVVQALSALSSEEAPFLCWAK